MYQKSVGQLITFWNHRNSPLQAHLPQTEPPRVANSFRSRPLTSNNFSQWLARTLSGTPDDNRIKATKSKGVYVGAGLNPISPAESDKVTTLMWVNSSLSHGQWVKRLVKGLVIVSPEQSQMFHMAAVFCCICQCTRFRVSWTHSRVDDLHDYNPVKPAFRHLVALSGNTKWSEINPTLHAMYFTGAARSTSRCDLCMATSHKAAECALLGHQWQHPEPRTNQSFILEPAVRLSQQMQLQPGSARCAPSREICRLCNSCTFARCCSTHICAVCRGDHPAIICPHAQWQQGKAPGPPFNKLL